MTEAAKKVAEEPCHCVQCGECNGWGRYLGNHRSDDLDDLETCEQCGGRGIIERCDRCQLLEEMDNDD